MTNDRSNLVQFDTFWYNYPLKQGKGAAEKAWAKINPDNDLAVAITAAVLNHKGHNKKWADGFVPMPSTFLNQRRWEDEVQGAPNRNHTWQAPGCPTNANSPYPGGMSRQAYEQAHTEPLAELLADMKASPWKFNSFLNTWGNKMPRKLREAFEGALASGKQETKQEAVKILDQYPPVTATT